MDKGQAWMYKIIVMICFTVAMFTPILFPTDIANARFGGPNYAMGIIFQILPFIIIILTFIVVPFFYSLYSTTTKPGQCSCCRIWKSMWKMLLVLIIAIVLGVVLYFFIGYADIPVTTVSADPAENNSLIFGDPNADQDGSFLRTISYQEGTRSLQMTIILYLLGIVELVGYVFILVFLGVGLASLPISMIRKFIRRPKPISNDKYINSKNDIKKRASDLREALKSLREKKETRKSKAALVRLKKAIAELEDEYRILMICHGEKKHNPLKYIGLLIAGIILLPISISIIVHIILSPLLDIYPFYNYFLEALADVWDILAIIIFGVLAIYMMFSVMLGISYFGFRFIMFIPIHPMRKGETSMGGMLFNMGMLLLCALGILPLLQQLFYIASEGGGSAMIYAQTVNMRYLGYVYKYGLWVVVALFPISLIVILLIPGKSAEKRAIEEASKLTLAERAEGRVKLYENAEVDSSY